jgi:cytoskeletal protein CcmA (bactofilin family)
LGWSALGFGAATLEEVNPLTIDASGSVEAMVSAHTIVVSGSANGILTASARVVLKEGAKVVGEVSAPVVSLAEGATVNGRIETQPKKSAAPAVLSLAS